MEREKTQGGIRHGGGYCRGGGAATDYFAVFAVFVLINLLRLECDAGSAVAAAAALPALLCNLCKNKKKYIIKKNPHEVVEQ